MKLSYKLYTNSIKLLCLYISLSFLQTIIWEVLSKILSTFLLINFKVSRGNIHYSEININCIAVLRWHFAWFLAISQSWYHGTRNEDKLGQVSAMVYLADKINIKNVFHVTSAQIHFQMTLIWKSMEETALERFKLNIFLVTSAQCHFKRQLFEKA